MIVCGLDTETTGLDVNVERILELGYVLWDTDTGVPLFMDSIIMYDDTYPKITQSIVDLTGIGEDYVKRFAVDPCVGFRKFLEVTHKHQPTVIVAYNGNGYDRPLLVNELKRNGFPLPLLVAQPWVDIMQDLPEPKSIKLKYLAAEHGFVFPFAHRAVFDVLTTLLIMQKYPLDVILESAKSPEIIARALVTFDDLAGREAAKKAGFRWQEWNGKTYPKMWVKGMKEIHLAKLKESASFQVVRIV